MPPPASGAASSVTVSLPADKVAVICSIAVNNTELAPPVSAASVPWKLPLVFAVMVLAAPVSWAE